MVLEYRSNLNKGKERCKGCNLRGTFLPDRAAITWNLLQE